MWPHIVPLLLQGLPKRSKWPQNRSKSSHHRTVQSAICAWSESRDGLFCFFTQAPDKRSQHVNATYRKIVGRNIARVWPRCCAVLRNVGCCWLSLKMAKFTESPGQTIATCQLRLKTWGPWERANGQSNSGSWWILLIRFGIQKTEKQKNWPYGWKYNSSIQPYGQFICSQFLVCQPTVNNYFFKT